MSSIDIDECTTGVHGCLQNQQCINRPGNYVCECVTGYELLNGTCEGNIITISYIYKLNVPHYPTCP